MIPEPGNLLVMARLNFRVKCNNHFRDSAPLGRCLLFYESRHFFMECACSYELYMIKWQAILLRMRSFLPHILNESMVYPGVDRNLRRIWISAFMTPIFSFTGNSGSLKRTYLPLWRCAFLTCLFYIIFYERENIEFQTIESAVCGYEKRQSPVWESMKD